MISLNPSCRQSNATAISMRQATSWALRDRRQCPELPCFRRWQLCAAVQASSNCCILQEWKQSFRLALMNSSASHTTTTTSTCNRRTHEPSFCDIYRSWHGPNARSKEIAACILPLLEKPCVIDADALNILAEEKALIPKHAVLTPHHGEMMRLLIHDRKTQLSIFPTLETCRAYAEEQ